MRKSTFLILTCLTVLLLSPALAAAQAQSCPNIVQQALALVSQDCASTGRNQACYGNVSIQASPQAGVTNFTFNQPGDMANVGDLLEMRLSGLDPNTAHWGVALMSLQANLPDTLPGQNVTMVLFGDVDIQEATAPMPLGTEEAATPESTPGAPMQTFYLRSGLTDPLCAEAPRDGVLIQSPANAGQPVSLVIDGVQISLGSTVFAQAQASGFLNVSTLEGAATLTAFGQSQIAAVGQQVQVPLDANLEANGPPDPPSPFDPNIIAHLPVSLLSTFKGQLVWPSASSAAAGTWLMSFGLATGNCPMMIPPPVTTTMAVSADGNTVSLSKSGQPTLTFTNDGTGIYGGSMLGSNMTFHFTSDTHAEGQIHHIEGGCDVTLPMTLDHQ